jgi:hypothetical protein
VVSEWLLKVFSANYKLRTTKYKAKRGRRMIA